MEPGWRRPRASGRAAHVHERSGVGARAESSPRLPRAPGGLRGGGRGVRQVRAGVHGPGRPPEEGPLRAGVRGPAELLRRRGQEDPDGRLLRRNELWSSHLPLPWAQALCLDGMHGTLRVERRCEQQSSWVF